MIPILETPLVLMAVVAVAAYLLGSIPFGLVISRAFGLGDIRTIGSGNIGATNVLRTGNKPAAALTLILDAGKAGAAVLLARALVAEDAAQIAGISAFFGHCFPIFLRFNGGKGVATFFGTLLALYWPVGIAAALVWLSVAALLRMSSLAGLIAAVLSPILAALLGMPQASLVAAVLAAVILLRHRENIRRIMLGTEPRIGK